MVAVFVSARRLWTSDRWRFRFSPVLVGRVRELQRLGRIDLIHAHAAAALRACGHAVEQGTGVPYVVSVHGLDAFSTEQVEGGRANGAAAFLERVYRSSRRVICISEHVREQVLEGTGTSLPDFRRYTTAWIRNCFRRVRVLLRRALYGEPVVLCVGNLIPIKGHEVLIARRCVACSRVSCADAGNHRTWSGTALACKL